MDLRLPDLSPTPEERAAIDALLGAPASAWDGGARGSIRDAHLAHGGHEQRELRHLLLPALHAIQGRVGWISESALTYICLRLAIPPAEAYGVATFYALLATTPRPRRVLHVCDDIGCRTRGARILVEELEHQAGPPLGHGPAGDAVTIDREKAGWTTSPCLGLCDQAPAALVTQAGPRPVERLLGGVGIPNLKALLAGAPIPTDATAEPFVPQRGQPGLRLLRRVGTVDPTSLSAYRAARGYEALARAVEIGPQGVITAITEAKLLGRGGAAFPTGRKWDAVRKQPATPHYLVCNADESEPGTFKDRVLLSCDPFAIVEAMTIAGFATGCEKGFIYLRAEYPLADQRLAHAIATAHSAGLLGENVLGKGFRFEIEIRRGAGAYICGEETAIFESIEGKRGEPRNKPPFPVQVGLFGKPTVVNNVETLANVPLILLDGAAAFASIGTSQSTGTRLFCLSGHVRRPGVYEVPFGTRLSTLLDLAGGVPAGRELRAILLGGAAGGFVRADELDLLLTHEDTKTAGTTLGSGVVMLFDDTADLSDTVLRIAAFFRDESCGQCVPCRVGTVRQEEALHRITSGCTRVGTEAELGLLDEIGVAMRDGSICGLGQTAYSAIESAIRRLGLFRQRGGSR